MVKKNLHFQITRFHYLEDWFSVVFCGLKWKQFPVGEVKNPQTISRPQKSSSRPKLVQQNIQKPKKKKKTAPKKTREINLYSPEYLAKKHGIKISDAKPEKKINKQEKGKVSFGFL